jgi:hypothetical protein
MFVRRRLSLISIIWIVIGVLVAASHHYFDHLTTIGAFLSAVLAILLWPLVLLGVHLTISI